MPNSRQARQARQALPGFDPSGSPARGTGGTARSGKHGAAAGRAGDWAAVPWPVPDLPSEPGTVTAEPVAPERAASERTGIAGAVTYLAVLVCTAAGVYISWRQGSHGGGDGGLVAGAALLVAAVVRLVLPGRLAGLLASRRRVTDVLTLTVLGVGLLVAGLVLPRLGPLSA